METDEMQTRSLSRSQLLPAWLIFLLRRLLFIAGVAFVIVYFCILGLRLSFHSATSDSTLHRTWELAGPTLKETGAFFGNLWRGELGYVYEGVLERTRLPVMAMVIDAYRQSMWLLLVSIAAAAVIGIVAGGLAAARRHTPLALPTLTLTVIGISIPSFFLALLFRVADIRFYQRTGIGLFPVFGISEHRTASLLPQVVAPALVLAARPVAHIARVTFVSLSDILGQEFIRTARAKGVHPTAVFWKHGVRNAGVSILTALVVSLRFALGSLPVVEIFFQWPGMGVATLEGIFRRDTAAVPALALALGITLMLINLGLGMVYRFIDPRLRAETDGGAA